jgi:hypothetical protein
MEKLTIEQVSTFLPFDVEFVDTVTGQKHILDTENLSQMLNDAEHLNTIRIVLRNISCLTKEITHDNRTFTPIVELLKNRINIAKPKNLTWIGDSIVYENLVLLQTKHLYLNFSEFQKLSEWKINFNGIPEHLYIDADTLENNPYK